MNLLVNRNTEQNRLAIYRDPNLLATTLGVSKEAVELCREAFFVDLHIDTMIPERLWGYDPNVEHRHWFGGRFFGHLDVPRMAVAGLDAVMWSITTNPFRTQRGRWQTFLRNCARVTQMIDKAPKTLRWVRNPGDLNPTGQLGIMLSIQGGNALDGAPESFWRDLPVPLLRVTLVHLTNSQIGATSAPVSALRTDRGLTASGALLIERLNEARIFVDLAHIHPVGFWQALEIHDNDRPPVVTHTGVSGVRPHWRNLDDQQIKAISDRGGVVGIMAHQGFLRSASSGDGVAMIASHIEHLWNVGGAQCAAIGTDFDGAIIPPKGFRSGLMYPRLVDLLMQRGHSMDKLEGLLGENFKRCFSDLRPT